ncbi:MAG: thiamine phosphate synthase [Candidatus Sumerlaeaceae bacterium]|nr:thiamine phosphate synthase [Candidatus Sumerlaeaceae bacterium]
MMLEQARNLCPKLYLITDNRGRPTVELVRIVERAIAGGVNAVQYREKSASPVEVRTALTELAKACRDGNVPLFLNADLLEAVGPDAPIDGIHWSKSTLPKYLASTHGLPSIYSAHSPGEILEIQATARPMDNFTLSPIFDTSKGPGIMPGSGLEWLRHSCDELRPYAPIALGGIDETNAAACITAGAAGVAVIRAIMSASNPQAAARALRQQVDGALETH